MASKTRLRESSRPLREAETPGGPVAPDTATRACAGPSARRVWGGFALACLSVALVRGLVALSRFDEYRGEELYIGSFALALREGLPLDPANLPIIVHLRGSVLFGALAWALSFVVGPSIALLKTLAVSWTALTAGALYLALERGANRRTAVCGLALFAFAVPSYQMVDVLALGSHGDVPLFLFGALATLFWCPGPLSLARAALFGFWIGAGSLFSLHFIVALPAFLVVWWRRDPRFYRRVSSLAVLAVAGAIAAQIPRLSRSTTLVQKAVGDHFFPDGVAGAWEKLARTVPQDLAAAWLFGENGGAVWTWVFGLALAVGAIMLLPRLRRGEPLALFCLLYPLSVIGAYVISDFELNLEVTKNGMGSRYFMPLLPLATTWIALACGSSARGLPARVAGGIAVLCGLTAGVVGWLSLLAPATAWAQPPLRASSFPHFAHLAYGAGPTFVNRLAWSRRLEPDWEATRYLRYQGLHPKSVFLARLKTADEFVSTVEGSAKLEGDERAFLLADVGQALGKQSERGDLTLLAAVLERTSSLDAAAFDRGVGGGIMFIGLADQIRTKGRRMLAFARLRELAGALPAERAERLFEGAGYQLGFLSTPYNDNYEAVLARTEKDLPKQAAEFAEAFLRGLAVGWRLRFLERSWSPPEPGAAQIERMLPERHRASFRAALASPAEALAAQ